MAKFRYVNTHFWDDGYVRKMLPSEKLLFLYLITNPCTTIAGTYEITMDRIKFDTGMDDKRLKDAIDRLTVAGKITYKDDWILVHNFIKNQSKPTKTVAGIKNILSQCPRWVLDTLSKGHLCPSDYLNLKLKSKTNNRARKSGSFDPRVVEIFSEVKRVLNHPAWVLDAERHTAIARWLDDYTLSDLILVPHGVLHSEWHMGKNPGKKKYHDPATIYKSAKSIDDFITAARGVASGSIVTTVNAQRKTAADYHREAQLLEIADGKPEGLIG
jgi:hypothetical protein